MKTIHSHFREFSFYLQCFSSLSCICEYLATDPLSIARFSHMQLSEMGHRGENGNDQALKQQQRGFEPTLSIESQAFYR